MIGQYSDQEITALVHHYQEFGSYRGPGMIGVRLMDLDLALAQLKRENPERFEALLLLGMADLTQCSAATLSTASRREIVRRYDEAMDTLYSYLNGERE